MSIKEQIKAEIERRQFELEKDKFFTPTVFALKTREFGLLLQFIDTLPDETDEPKKDPALTLEDVVMIGNIILDLKAIHFNDGYLTRPFYEEVLKRFNELNKQ